MEKILLTGPKIGSVSGISTHLQNIINSKLSQKYKFIITNAGKNRANENAFQKTARIIVDYLNFIRLLAVTDLVHINTSFSEKALLRDVILSVICKIAKKRHVIHFHSGKPVEEVLKKLILRNLIRFLNYNSDGLIFLLKSEKEYFNKYLKKKNNYQIYNGINYNLYKTIHKNFCDSGLIRLGYIGRIDYSKGILDSIEVVKILICEKQLPVNFMIAGYGNAENIARKKSKEYGIDQNVKFLGIVNGDQKKKFWETVDIFLFPTKFSEGIPYALLESMASGTPVITTQSGGLKEIIEKIPCIIVVDQKNIEKIVNEIIDLVKNPSRMVSISNSLRRSAKMIFSINKMVNELEECYKKVLMQNK